MTDRRILDTAVPHIEDVVFQASYALHDDARTAKSFEALLRPLETLHGARRRTDLAEITRAVLTRVCREIEGREGIAPIQVNLPPSVLSFRNMPQEITQIVDRYHVPHGQIGLEILEHPFHWTLRSREAADVLRRTGFSILLDDYTGEDWQNEVLQGFPFDKVKIDCSIVRNHGLKNTFNALSVLGVRNIVVEGVETRFELEEVIKASRRHPEMDVLIQGFLFSTPEPAERVFH